MGVIAHGHQILMRGCLLNYDISTLYTLSDHARDGELVQNGARNNRMDEGQVCPN